MKDWVDIVSKIISSLAIVIGAAFAWWKWGREKPQVERANLTHRVFLSDIDDDNLVVHVTLEIQNKGSVRLNLKCGWTEVRKVSPVDDTVRAVLAGDRKFGENKTELDWPLFDRREYDGKLLGLVIDSGETECLHSDFILPTTHKVIAIRSGIDFRDFSSDVWPCITFVDVGKLVREQPDSDKL
jgi:hypothetical protein